MHEQTTESLAQNRPADGRARRRGGHAVPVEGAAERLRATLRQRLIAFYLMPSDADRWIGIWTGSVAAGDPSSADYWDRGFRWILTAVAGHGHDHAAPCSDVDPALAAVITRGFRA